MNGAPAARGLSGVPDALWSAVATAAHRLLALDYDGTLAPLRADRDAATPLPGVVPLIERIAAATGTTVALVTGRSIADLDRLIAAPRAHAIGEHGWEWRAPGGPIERHRLPDGCAPALARAAAGAAARGWHERLERKRASVMLHTRGLAEGEAQVILSDCRALWSAVAAGTPLALRPVDGGLELRATGRDKGTAIRDLLAGCPAGTVAVYAGDDDTDEDAFRALGSADFGLRVGGAGAPTAARGRLPSSADVLALLEAWAAHLPAGGAAAQPAGAGRGGGPR
jgi:trehalose-phosphatase